MNSKIYRIPCALVIAFTVSNLVLDVMGIFPGAYIMVAVVMTCAFLLSQRNLVELALIGMLTLFVQVNTGVLESSSFSHDWLLGMLISIILLPTASYLMGFETRTHRLT